MKLEKTAALMKEKAGNQIFRDYGIYVSLKGQTGRLMSEKVDMDTYVDVASMGKVLVTSTLILQAAGQKKIALDQTLPNFFDSVPKDKKNITLKQLLTHSSGIVRYNFPEKQESPGDAPRFFITPGCSYARGSDYRWSEKEVERFILDSPLGYEPGSRYQYSCNGYILLGMIAEKVFGDRLDRLFESRIKAPLGLTRSKFNIAVDEPNAMLCYRRKEVGDFRVDDENVYKMGGIAGNGASFWTMRDMITYIEAVLKRDSRLYDASLFDLAETNLTPELSEGRGLGYLVINTTYPQGGRLFPVGSFGHCGHCGHSFYIDRSRELYAIVLTNAVRTLNQQNDYKKYDYSIVEAMRAEIHSAIHDDLKAEGLL